MVTWRPGGLSELPAFCEGFARPPLASCRLRIPFAWVRGALPPRPLVPAGSDAGLLRVRWVSAGREGVSVKREELRLADELPREISDVRADEVVPRSPSWLWEERIPLGGVTLVAGPRGAGKTAFGTWLAAQVTSGAHPDIRQGVVWYSSSEDSLEVTLRPRVEAAGGNLGRCYFPGQDEALSFPADEQAFARKLTERSVILAVIDPLEGHLSAGVTAVGNAGMRRTLQGLERVADRFGCALVLLHHWRKSGGTVMEAIGGGSAITNTVRTVHTFAPEPPPNVLELLFGKQRHEFELDEPDSGRVLAVSKFNLAPQPERALLFELGSGDATGVGSAAVLSLRGEADWRDEELLAALRRLGGTQGGIAREEESEVAKAAAFIIAYLGSRQRCPSSDLTAAAKVAGFAERTMQRARRELGVVAEQKEGIWWVRLPPPPDTLPEGWS